jgi:hypothetical protein
MIESISHQPSGGGEKVKKKIMVMSVTLLVISLLAIPTVSACNNRNNKNYSVEPYTGSMDIQLVDTGKVRVVHGILYIKDAYWKGTAQAPTSPAFPYERWYTIILNLKTGRGIWIARATTTIEVAPGVVIGTFEGGGFGKITDYVFSSGIFKVTGTGAVEGVIVMGSMRNEIVDGDWVTVGSHALTEVSGWTYTPIE